MWLSFIGAQHGIQVCQDGQCYHGRNGQSNSGRRLLPISTHEHVYDANTPGSIILSTQDSNPRVEDTVMTISATTGTTARRLMLILVL